MKIAEIRKEVAKLTRSSSHISKKQYLKMIDDLFGIIVVKLPKEYDRLLIDYAIERLRNKLNH